jgi:thiamine transporter ThiT
MTTALSIQIIVYMIILAFIAFAWGYRKGHRDGMLMGRIQARKLERLAKAVK